LRRYGGVIKYAAMEPEKKAAWITGASSGIGQEPAKALAAGGAYVIISSNEEEELERVRVFSTVPFFRTTST